MTIDETYQLVKILANKINIHIPSPRFQLLAQRAQMELAGEIYKQPERENLRTLVSSAPLYPSKYGQATLPANFLYPITLLAAYYPTDTEVPYRSQVKVLAPELLHYRLASRILQPSLEFPVCTIEENFVQFYPENIPFVGMQYYRNPADPVWGYTLENSREVYDPTTSVDFELPEQTHNQIAIKILSYIGIHIREAELIQYSNLKEADVHN